MSLTVRSIRSFYGWSQRTGPDDLSETKCAGLPTPPRKRAHTGRRPGRPVPHCDTGSSTGKLGLKQTQGNASGSGEAAKRSPALSSVPSNSNSTAAVLVCPHKPGAPLQPCVKKRGGTGRRRPVSHTPEIGQLPITNSSTPGTRRWRESWPACRAAVRRSPRATRAPAPCAAPRCDSTRRAGSTTRPCACRSC